MKNQMGIGLSLACMAGLFAGEGWARGQWVEVAEDKPVITVQAQGVKTFSGSASVVFMLGNEKKRMMGNEHWKRVSPVMDTTCPTPFGDAFLRTITYGREDAPYRLTLHVKQLKGVRAFTVQGVFHNDSAQDIHLETINLLDTTPGGGAFTIDPSDRWIVTPLLNALIDIQPLTGMNLNVPEAALLRNQKGEGFLAGPVGPAEAYTGLAFRENTFRAYAQMDGVLVRAGESRASEEMIFCFEPGRTATDIWTRWVAVTHGARLNKGSRYGWCSWYDRVHTIDAKHVLNITKIVEDHPNVFGRGIIQIDDGYQKMDGDWSGNQKFPMGLAAVAKTIRDAGCTPGVWFAPLRISPKHPFCKAHPEALQKNRDGSLRFVKGNPARPDGSYWIIPDHPVAKPFLSQIIRDARERGFGYLKIDFNNIGQNFYDPTKTQLQIFRELYAMYRSVAGEEMYILSCIGHPQRGVIGFVDATRVGPDSHPAFFPKCLDSVLRFQMLENVWWQNDPDVSYLAGQLKSRRVGKTPQGEGMWRTWHNVVALTGGSALISEPLDAPDCQSVWRNFEIMRPSSREKARLLTLGKEKWNQISGFAASRSYGNFAVYHFYNSEKPPQSIALDFGEAGIPKNVRCAVYDFWKNQVVGYAQDRYVTPMLNQYSSQLLRFTPIFGENPILVGSNLHLSIGATEIKSLSAAGSSIRIGLTDAGARQGNLIFYSEFPLEAGPCKNCRISQISKVGDKLWSVALTDRQWGKEQSLSVKIRR